MTNKQRPSGTAPLGSRDFYEKVNPYWLIQAARLEAEAASRKRGRVGPQGRKVASLTNKK